MYSLMTIGVVCVLVVFACFFIANLYKRCSSDEILVVYGSGLGGKTSVCIHGGGRVIIPLIQGYKYLPLKPIQIEVELKGALSKNNIRVDVPSTFTVAISTQPDIMKNAAERILNLNEKELHQQTQDIVLGQLRAVIAQMTIEEINADRDKFLQIINENVETEINKLGLHVINVNIRDINDGSGYIQAIGQKAAAVAINQANVDVAQQQKLGAVGVATAEREREVSVAAEQSQMNIGQKEADRNQKIKVAQLEAEIVRGENESKASVAEYNAILAEKEAESLQKGEVAKAKALEAVLKAQKEQEVAKLEKEQLAQEEVKKKKMEVEASAKAEQTRLIANGEADAIKAKYEAEAEGIKKVMEAKAEGIKKLVESCGNDAKAASSMLLIEIMPKIVETQAEALKNVKIDKVTVWDSGSGEGKSGVKGYTQGLLSMLAPFHEVSKLGGLELPEFLGKVIPDEEKEKQPQKEESKKNNNKQS